MQLKNKTHEQLHIQMQIEELITFFLCMYNSKNFIKRNMCIKLLLTIMLKKVQKFRDLYK